MSQISLKDVSKRYQVGNMVVRAVEHLSLEIERGEFVVILGQSGSGKTTLLNLLGGLERADEGSIYVDGEMVSKMDDNALTLYRRRKVGFIFQFFNLLPTLTTRENVALTAEMSANAYDPAVLLGQVKLGDRIDHYPGQLSGGQQQRVAIARALAKKPALVLADEPTGSLDIETGIEVLDVMRSLNRETGQTFVVVTHNAAIAQIADRVIRIGNGAVQRVEMNAKPLNPRELTW